jgi:hypothetical protein
MKPSFKRLTQEQLDKYNNDGGVAPVRGFGEREAAHYRERLEAFERELGMPLMAHPQKPSQWSKSHLLFSWKKATSGVPCPSPRVAL